MEEWMQRLGRVVLIDSLPLELKDSEHVKAALYNGDPAVIPFDDKWYVLYEAQWLIVEPDVIPELLLKLVQQNHRSTTAIEDWLAGNMKWDTLQLWMDQHQWTPEFPLVGIAVHIEQEAEAIPIISQLVEDPTRFHATRSNIAVESGTIFVLLEGCKEDRWDMLSSWQMTLETELLCQAHVGVSSFAFDIHQMSQVRMEAWTALQAGSRYSKRDRIHLYDRLEIARILYSVPDESRQAYLEEMVPVAVGEQLTPELRETIVAFAEHGQRLTDTAKALFIHRNTLLYRIERILEITGRDIRKSQENWLLWLALQWLQDFSSR